MQDLIGANARLNCTIAHRTWRYDYYKGNSTEYLQWQDSRNYVKNRTTNKWGW